MGQAFTTLTTVGQMWGNIVLLTVLFSGVVHSLFGFISIWKLVMKDGRAIFTPLLYFIVGALYGLALSAAPSGLIAACYSVLQTDMKYGDCVVYSAVLCCVILYFSSGKNSIMYSF
eukprot:GILI01027217.1.p1 GENE.GILI01027217.1~~GILI01027217.1.p1  ORF type:complete len:116 (-),score=6.37 GILI01027217.1:23-370(-)